MPINVWKEIADKSEATIAYLIISSKLPSKKERYQNKKWCKEGGTIFYNLKWICISRSLSLKIKLMRVKGRSPDLMQNLLGWLSGFSLWFNQSHILVYLHPIVRYWD